MLSKYAPWLHATFVREEDAAAIPTGGRVIQVAAPQLNTGGVREGGIGLADLVVYLNPETREQALLDREARQKDEKEERDEWGPPAEGRVMDVKLERTSPFLISLGGLHYIDMLSFHILVHHEMPSSIHKSFGFDRRGPPHVQNPFRTQELAHAISAFGGFVDPPPEGDSQRDTSMQRLTRQWERMIYPPRNKSDKTTRTQAPRREDGDDGVGPSGALDRPDTAKPDEPISWTGFGTNSVAPVSTALPLSDAGGIHQNLADAPAPAPNVALPNASPAAHRDLSATPVPDVPSSGTPLPGAPSAQSKPAEPTPKPSVQPKPTLSEAHPKPLKSKSNPETNTTPPPLPPSTPPEPKTSKRKRLLNAARLAGALTAESQAPSSSASPAGAETRPVEDLLDVRSEMTANAHAPDDRPAEVEAGRDAKASESENKAAARKWWNFLTGGN